jgi:biotin carboxyl carrier protein
MASSCNLGAANVKLAKLDSGRVRFCSLQQRNTARIWIGQRPLQYASLVIAHQSERAFNVCFGSSSETASVKNIAIASKENESLTLTSQLIPNASEVESLVTDICDTTSIAEFDLKLGGFRLHVKRNVSAKTSQIPPPLPPQPATPAPTTAITKVDATASNGAVSSTSLVAITKPSYATGGVESFLGRAADEGLMILTSPRVGFFRRSRAIKGKRGPPSCKENQIVKEGQVLCYIEQFGGEIPIESDIAGEIVRILRKDGEPVGYGDALLAVLPSFPGIKKLQ